MLLEITSGFIENLPFKGLQKKSDLFSFDYNPVLSHYTDSKGNDYLFYWVDFANGINRWLCFKVSKDTLYYYLNDGITLRELIFDKSENPYLFIINQDSTGNFNNGYLVMPDDVPNDYLPSENSYFEYDFPSSYRDYFIEIDYVTREMRKKAVYLGIEAKTSQFGRTVDTKDMIELIEKTEKSYMEYAKEDFYLTYRDQYSEDKIGEVYEAIKPHAKLRMCNVEYGSFKIALCSDITNDTIDAKFLDWKKRIVLSFKNDVIDHDFSSEVDALKIKTRFPNIETRERIFAPFISLLENKNVNVIVTNQAKTTKKQLSIGKKSREIILPKKTVDQYILERIPEMDIIQTYLAVPKGKSLVSKSISAKQLKEMTLFSQVTDSFPMIVDEVRFGNSTIELFSPIRLTATYKNGQYESFFDLVNIKVRGGSKEELIQNFKAEFVRSYLQNQNELDAYNSQFQTLVKNITGSIGESPF